MFKFSANVAFNKVTNGQTDIKHEMGETLSSMSQLRINRPVSEIYPIQGIFPGLGTTKKKDTKGGKLMAPTLLDSHPGYNEKRTPREVS